MGAGDPVLAYGDVAATDAVGQIVEDRVTEGQIVALDSQALSFGPKQAVDALFEPGWYDQWQALRQETPGLRQRTAANQTRYRRIEGFGARSQLVWDIRTLNSLATDYDDRMTRAANGERINVEEARNLYAMYSLAIGVVDYDNDALDAAFEAGVVAGFLLFPFVVLQVRAQRLQELLKALKVLLEQAKKDVKEAWIQGVVDLAIAGITSFLPLGLVARGGVLIAQSIFDTAMGPSTSTAVTVGSNESKAGEFAAAVAEVRAASARERAIAGAGGKTVTVVGFALDAYEIFGVAYKNVDRIASAIREATAVLTKLNDEIVQYSAILQKFVEQYQAWQTSIASLRTQADLIRRALEDDLRRNKYNVH
jgi:hypothetical protein